MVAYNYRQHNLPMDWQAPPPGFNSILFERVEVSRNINRFYLVSWQPTLLETGAVVRLYGRKAVTQRLLITPFSSLEAAWPLIRSIIKTRLRHGYHIVTGETGAIDNVEQTTELNS